MYWALTGRYIPTMIPKHNGGVDIAVAAEAAEPASPNELKPKIPVGVSRLVMECISKSPSDRPGDMPTLISRLDLLIHMIAGNKLIPNNEK